MLKTKEWRISRLSDGPEVHIGGGERKTQHLFQLKFSRDECGLYWFVSKTGTRTRVSCILQWLPSKWLPHYKFEKPMVPLGSLTETNHNISCFVSPRVRVVGDTVTLALLRQRNFTRPSTNAFSR